MDVVVPALQATPSKSEKVRKKVRNGATATQTHHFNVVAAITTAVATMTMRFTARVTARFACIALRVIFTKPRAPNVRWLDLPKKISSNQFAILHMKVSKFSCSNPMHPPRECIWIVVFPTLFANGETEQISVEFHERHRCQHTNARYNHDSCRSPIVHHNNCTPSIERSGHQFVYVCGRKQ